MASVQGARMLSDSACRSHSVASTAPWLRVMASSPQTMQCKPQADSAISTSSWMDWRRVASSLSKAAQRR